MIEKKFEVIRNEEEHNRNICHSELKLWYEYYRGMGCSKDQALRYSKWNIENKNYWEKGK